MRSTRSPLAGLAAVLGALAFLAGAPAHAQATLYKWVDEKGVTHYSDQPRAGASKVVVQPAQGFQPPPAPRAPAGGGARPAQQPAAAVYDRVEIVRPESEEVFVNTGGVVDVDLVVEPELQPGHQVWFTLDGNRLDAGNTAATSVQIEATRGSHELVATITDGDGRVIVRSKPVAFHVRQTSVATPPTGPALRPQPGPAPARPGRP